MCTYCQFHVTFHILGNFSELKNSDSVIENKYGLRCSKESDIIWNPLPRNLPHNLTGLYNLTVFLLHKLVLNVRKVESNMAAFCKDHDPFWAQAPVLLGISIILLFIDRLLVPFVCGKEAIRLCSLRPL